MTQQARRTRCNALTRKALMMSCATAALATSALMPQAAKAQAFQGTIASNTGSVTRTPTTGTTETITIGSNNATINWNAGAASQQQSGPIDFLPNGHTATFTSTPGVADYTVLNRIVPTTGQPIALNGHVISTLQGTSTVGGHIWFYAPGGIVVGATAVFDVGGLLLTTNDVTSFGTTANGFNASFSGASGSTSRIQIMSGAQINALQQNSYVALVAPRIEQGGTVRVNGTAAYAAGEQLSMTMNQGLFDIQVDVGTGDSNGIVHTGETSGPANPTASDHHKIYMVAVPKNQALTMLLGGKVGFDDAVSANVRNGQIFLSSGWGVHDSDGSGQYYTSTSGRDASIEIGAGNYTSDVTAFGQGELTATADTGDVTFGGNVELNSWSGTGPLDVSLVASDGHHLSVAGDVNLLSSQPSDFGSASILADSGGSVTIGGAANLYSWDGANGGFVSLLAEGGTIAIAGATHLYAAGVTPSPGASETTGMDAQGGNIFVQASDEGAITTGALLLDAFANGQANINGGAAGSGQGGTIWLGADSSGSITVNGNLTANATGTGGNAVPQGGDGTGGTTSLFGDGGAVTVNGDLNIYSNGTGGNGQTAGDGYGGSAFAEFTGGEGSGAGSLTVTGTLRAQAIGTGGNGTANAEGTGGQGGDGIGGLISFGQFFGEFSALSAGSTNLDLAAIEFNAKGQGGDGGAGSAGGDGGSGEGGSIVIALNDGATTAGDMSVFARGVGGDGGSGSNGLGGDGGSAFGGSVELSVYLGSSLTGATYHGSTNALGGNGGSGSSGSGDGGSAQSGSDDAFIDGTVTFGGDSNASPFATGFVLTSFAQGGTGNSGGWASAGSSSIDINGSLTVAGLVEAAAQAVGGNGTASGGFAEAGSASVSVFGSLTTDALFVGNNATGGAGASLGGDAYGGTASLSVDGGNAHIATSADLQATATGGNASNGSGGFASGGFADIEATEGGSLTGGDLTANVNATGGNGTSAGGATGGEIDLIADSWDSGEPTSVSLGQVHLTANGNVGTGNPGEASGFGGDILVEGNGGTIGASLLSAQANGTNFGGFIDLESSLGFDDLKGSLQFGAVNGTANGQDDGGFIVVATGSGSTIDLGTASLTASGAFGGNIYLLAGTCIECGEGEAAAQSPALPVGGGIAATDLTLNTTGNIFMGLSGGADIAVSGTLSGNAGQTISMFDDGEGGAIRAHEIDLFAILIDDNAQIVADIIKFTSTGSMTLGNLSATDLMTLTSGGNLITGDLTAGNALTLNAGDNVDTGDLSAQTVKVTATNDTTVADVHASGSATFTAGGLATFDGIVNSPTITVTSSDIDVAEGASLGVWGTTNLITLNAISHGLPILIGDADAAEGQYHLSEDGDIRSASIVINALGATPGTNADVKVADVNIEGSTTSGGGLSNVTLNTGGSVFVEGDVSFINAGANDKLTINAGHAIEVNTDTGGIVITDSAGKLAGTLDLNADNIWVGSQSLLTQLEGDANFTGRDAALATNSGTANQDGFIRAGTITAGVANTFFVQNSGTPDLFAGIDTGDGGLSIGSTGNTPALVIIFGRETQSAGTVITNQDFLGIVHLAGTAGFTTDSAVNGCVIGSTCNEAPATPGIDSSSILGPLGETDSQSDDDKKKDKDNDESDDGSSVDPSLRLINTTPINLNRPIEEPVTSGGDVVIGGSSVQPN